MAEVAERLGFSTGRQVEVLRSLENFVREQIDQHLSRRKLWFPNDLTAADRSADDDTFIRNLRGAAKGLPAAVLVAVALNLLTEEGLPHFHRLIATHMGADSTWCEWNNIWTAEEDRHGCALRDYVREARLFEMRPLEQMQYQYIEAGFNPDWEGDPYRLLAYTSLQERATQMAHANTGRLAGPVEPHLQRVLAHLAGDESRHYAFYRNSFAAVLEQDPDQALQSLLKIAPALAMPGHTIDGYQQMADVVRRADIYGPRHYQKIVEELLSFWKIGELKNLSAVGAAAQDKLMKIPRRLERMADYLEARTQGLKSFSFPFLNEGPLSV